MNGVALDRALTRIAHQILEKNLSIDNLGFVGMQTRGVFLAQRIVKKINEMEKSSFEVGVLDTTLYRDDYRMAFKQPEVRVTDIPFDINTKDLILFDDVLYTGRTVRAALDAITDFGRPKSIQLAVLVDRGGREFPIHADYIGKEVKTLDNQEVALRVTEFDDEDSLWLMQIEGDK